MPPTVPQTMSLLTETFAAIRHRRALPWLLGVALLLAVIIGVEQTLGWRQALSPWRQLPVSTLLSVLLLTLGSLLLRAVRMLDLAFGLTLQRLRLQGGAMARLALLHNLFNNLLPMRLGELTYPILMRRYFGRSLWGSGWELVWLRLLDLHFIALLALAYLPLGSWQSQRPLLLLGWITTVPLLYLLHRRLRRVGGEGGWVRLLQRLVEPIPDSFGRFLRIWLWTVAAWGVKFIAFATIIIQFSGLAVGAAVIGAIGGELSSVLPIHGIAGAGSYEAATVGALLPLGVSLEQALLVAVNLHLYLLLASVLFGGGALLLPSPASESGAG